MKKMFTLVSGLLMAVVLMAADRRPVVTVNTMDNFRIVIDGKSYFSNRNSLHIANLSRGPHSIQVYEMRRGFYDRRERLITSTTFFLRKNDLRILVGRMGDVRIREARNRGRFERDDDDWYERNRRDDHPRF